MSFIADKQTLGDLNMLGKYKADSIFSLFNKVHTTGALRLLETMFNNPLTDAFEINKRSSTFRFFQDSKIKFPLDGAQCDKMEAYLGAGEAGGLLISCMNTVKMKMLAITTHNESYAQMLAGLQNTITVLKALDNFLEQIPDQHTNPYRKQILQVKLTLDDKRLQWLRNETTFSDLSILRISRYSYLLKATLKPEMDAVVKLIHHLDLFIAVATTSAAKGFAYAEALPQEQSCISAQQLRHPCLENAVANPVNVHRNNNVMFLTGANMAGKSTFMKTFGIAIYLAHMGFPVAAANMHFSVMDGIYSSINVPDNLSRGYSHFYAEVLRVKTVALEVSRHKNLVVIFDELFKGTNVKDAYDATLAVSAAFAEYRNCFFIISTHIIEVGETLRKQCDNLQFRYFPTVMDGNLPRYTYQLTEGITSDRQGMMIIENEGILEILK